MRQRDADLDAIGLLQDAARRSLYDYVVAQRRPVGRNEAAQAVGIQRSLAAFHLDRLAEGGLLAVSYQRLSARSGPGAGRPAKLYQRPAGERSVSLPPRDYLAAAQVLAEAVERSGAEEVVFRASHADGVAIGRGVAEAGELLSALAARGYEPYTADDGMVRLRNCPFDALAQEHPVVACGMNHALLSGIVAGSGLTDRYEARLDPLPGDCCVVLVNRRRGPPSDLVRGPAGE